MPADGVETVEELDGGRVATSHPRITAGWFSSRGMQVETVAVRGSAEIGLSRISARVGKPSATAWLVIIDPKEWPSTMASAGSETARANSVIHRSYPAIECGASVIGVDAPNPGRSGLMKWMPGSSAITGSRPW